MPYKFDTLKLRLPEKFDKRIRISKKDHPKIRKLYESGKAIRAIARLYSVDHRTIQFILFPERIEASRKNRDWRNYTNREKLTKATRELRQRKKLIFKNHESIHATR